MGRTTSFVLLIMGLNITATEITILVQLLCIYRRYQYWALLKSMGLVEMSVAKQVQLCWALTAHFCPSRRWAIVGFHFLTAIEIFDFYFFSTTKKNGWEKKKLV